MNTLQLKKAFFFAITFLVVLSAHAITAYNQKSSSDEAILSATLAKSTQNSSGLGALFCFNSMEGCFFTLSVLGDAKDVVFRNNSTAVFTYNVKASLSSSVDSYVTATSDVSCKMVAPGGTCSIAFKAIAPDLNTGIVTIAGYDLTGKQNTNTISIGITTTLQ